MEFPTISLGEVYLSPSSMIQRDLAAMDTEEMIRAQSFDGVVLLASCDKTTPAALMGAVSANIPAIMLSLNAVQLSHIVATHRLEIRGNGGCAKIEVHSN